MSGQLTLKRKILYISVPYILILVLFTLAEVAVRKNYAYVTKLALVTGGNFERKVEIIPGRGQQVFEGDTMLGWKLMSGLNLVHWDFTTFSTNDQGIRYPEDLSRKKNGTLRIVSLGDSVTFGYRVPVAFPENPLGFDSSQKTFSQLLEESLKNKIKGKDVEVIPLAVPGYTSHQGLLWLRRDIGFVEPDLIIVLFGWNDTEMHRKSDSAALPDNWIKQAELGLLSGSQALIYFNKWLQKSDVSAEVGGIASNLVPRVSKEEFINNMLAISELAKENNSKVLFIGTVLRDVVTEPEQSLRIAEYRKALAEVAEERNLNYLEIPELTEAGSPENSALFGELIHPNSAGHKLMAERILEAINSKKLLDIFNSGI